MSAQQRFRVYHLYNGNRDKSKIGTLRQRLLY
nr:MAG TPA: hypothetical protein [Caudoviricetes sp.]